MPARLAAGVRAARPGDLESKARRYAEESSRRHADGGDRGALDEQETTDDAGIAAPRVEAQHRHRLAVVVRPTEAPGGGDDAERLMNSPPEGAPPP